MRDMDRLRQLANRQYGYFTAQQAVEAGFVKQLQAYHVRCGDWTKIDRALYRLTGFPDSAESLLTRWSLWGSIGNRHGCPTVGYDSALFYFGLTPRQPAQTHLIVPTACAKKEHAACRLYRQELRPDEIDNRGGFQITTPLRTLRDLQPDLMLNARWSGTILLAREKELLTEIEACFLMKESVGNSGGTPEFRPERAFAPASPAAAAANGASAPGDPVMSVVPSRPRSDSSGLWSRRSASREWLAPSRSFTLIEMLVVVAIIAILAGLLMPALQKAIGSSRAMQCTNNERQVGVALMGYVEAYQGYLPVINSWSLATAAGNWSWTRSLAPFIDPSAQMDAAGELKAVALYQCPVHTARYVELGGSNKANSPNFSMNINLGIYSNGASGAWRKYNQIRRPSKTLCISEGGYFGAYNWTAQLDGFYLQIAASMYDGLGAHNSSINILWCDGSVSSWFDGPSITRQPYSGTGAPDSRWSL